MTINTNATDNSAAIAAQAFLNVKQNQTTTASPGGASDLQAWSSLISPTNDADGDIDSTSAEQLTQSLAQTMLNNSNSALQAQSGGNAQSVLDLLQ